MGGVGLTAPAAWRAADIRSAQKALDGFALQARDRVTRGDWRVFWRERVATDSNLRRLLLAECAAEVARCRDWHAAGEVTLARVRADHAAAVVAGFPVPIANASERVRYHERSQAKLAARVRAAERLAAVAVGELPADVLGYWPLGVAPPS